MNKDYAAQDIEEMVKQDNYELGLDAPMYQTTQHLKVALTQLGEALEASQRLPFYESPEMVQLRADVQMAIIRSQRGVERAAERMDWFQRGGRPRPERNYVTMDEMHERMHQRRGY